jgi:acylphosphatase
VVNNTDGRQEVFAIGDDDAVWHTWQHSPNGSWSAWSSLGGVWFDFGGAVSTRNNDGRLEVFARGMDKAIYHSWQQTPGGTWTPWYSLGGSFAGDPAVGIAPDGRVEVFARSADNSLRHMWQVPGTATGWSPWVNRGGNITADPKVGTNADGRLEVFAPAGGGVAHQWQTTPGGGWSGWLPLVGVSLPADTPLLITRNADKRLEVFGVNASGALMHVWQKVPNGDWPTSWFPIGGPFRPQLGYGVNADQRMELVMLTGAEHDARHQWQAPGSPSGWSGIAPLP